jgi:3-deoxy-D-arabino-heptulosonate 7-phosphate (DAHP) synthase
MKKDHPPEAMKTTILFKNHLLSLIESVDKETCNIFHGRKQKCQSVIQPSTIIDPKETKKYDNT